MKQFKRALFIAVALCMMLSLLPTMAFAAEQSSCTVTFKVDGSVYKEETVELTQDSDGFTSGKVTKPKDPTKASDSKRYEFSGWKTEEGTDFFKDSDSGAVNKDLTLNAAWVEYLAEGYELVLSSNTVSQDYKTPISQIPGYDAGASIRKIEKKRTKVAESEPVAKIGETLYNNLQDAVTAANNGNTVTLLTNIDATEQIKVDKQLTLDLNGKIIEYKGTERLTSGVIMVRRGGDLTIQDIDNNGAIKSGSSAYAAVALTHKDDNGEAPAKLTVNSGILEGYYYAVTGNGNRHGTEITINGGTLRGTCPNDSYGIYHPQDGTLTITGGTITGDSAAVELRSGTLKISGGTFEAKASAYECNANGNGTTTKGAAIAIAQHTTNKPINAIITSGNFTVPASGTAKKLSVSNPQGNTFANVAVSGLAELIASATVPEGYMWADGETAGTKVLAKIVAKIDSTSYANLSSAFAAAQDGNTIVLQEDVTLSDRLFINAGATPAYDSNNKRYATTSENKAITLNLNGYNITSSSNLALAGGSLTITGTGTIQTNASGLAPVEIRGTGSLSDKRTLTIGTGVTLQGQCYGLNVFGSNNDSENLIDVNVNGTVKGTLFVLGNLKNTDNEINIVVNGKVEATDSDANEPNVGIALNGYANVTVNEGATVTGESGIEIRAGSLTVNGGTITATGASLQEMANNNGSTVIGAAVAVSQHSTDLATSVTIHGGSFTGDYAFYENDVQNNTGRDKISLRVTDGTFTGNVSSENCTGFITGGTFSTDPSACLSKSYDAEESSNGTWTVKAHTHSYDYDPNNNDKQPDWIWRRINGEWAAVATFTCVKGDETQKVLATVTSSSGTGTTTYTAKATFQNQEYTCPEVKTEAISYTVTFSEGSYSNSTFHWGELCTLTYGDGNQAKKWYINDRLVADGRGSYTFAVTEDSVVRTEDTPYTAPIAVASVTLTSTESTKAVYNVKWSLPTDAQNVTAMIYRGAKSTYAYASRNLLERKGIRIDTGLNVRNGDFTLKISNLSTDKYQNVITVITYESDGKKWELVTPVFHIQAGGSSSTSSFKGDYSNREISS